MNRKIVSEILSLLLLIGVFAFSTSSVKAITAIYIRADGRIDPPTAPIITFDNVTYTLTDNIYISGSFNDGIVVERNNIMLDGAGFSLKGGALSTGIELSGRNNVTARNINIEGFHVGINFISSSGNLIFRNNFTGNNAAIIFDQSSSNSVVGNNITANIGSGIYVRHSSNSNHIIGNSILGNDNGITLDSTSNCNNITKNLITTCE